MIEGDEVYLDSQFRSVIPSIGLLFLVCIFFLFMASNIHTTKEDVTAIATVLPLIMQHIPWSTVHI